MLLFTPLLAAIIPGVTILTLTWWFIKKGFSSAVKVLPGLTAMMAAAVLFYIGFVSIRGFEGAVYGILALFLLIIGGMAIIMVRIRKNVPV